MKELNNGTILHGKLDYKIDKCLGQGGFGITYLASGTVQLGNIKHQLPFTIKEFFMQQSCQRQPNGEMTVLPGQEESVNEHQKEFLREAERLNKLDSHQGIVSVNEIFHQNNTIYYVMEYLGSMNLEDYIKEHGGKLTEEEATPVFTKIASALNFLHSKKITHLDVKPANIMMRTIENDEQVPVLIDFGLAVHYSKKGDPTRENKMICCSDGYSPLEQYLGISTFSPEADVYALGATLFYMLTGTKPPMASEMSSTFLQDKLGGKISEKLLAILKKCMGKLPEQRYPTLSEMLNELSGDEPVGTVEASDDSGATRVIGQKAPKKSKTAKPKPVVKPAAPKVHKESKPMDPALIKRIGIGVGALVVLGVIGFGISKCGSMTPSTDETDTTATVVTDTVKVDSVAAPQENPQEEAVAQPEAKKEETKEEPAVKPEPKPEKKTEAEVKKPEPKPEPKVEPKPEPEPKTQVASDGSVNLGYGTYTGGTKNGKPHGTGTLVFTSSHKIEANDSEVRMASPGDKITGKFVNGKVSFGRWIKSSGEIETLMIGN